MNMEQFNKLCYDTLRELHDVTTKVNIMSIILYARDDSDKYCKVLYADNGYQDILDELEGNDIHLHVDFTHPNVLSAYNKTIDQLRLKDDKDGFYKALYECDEYAIACYEISRTFDNKKSVDDIIDMIRSDNVL